jgi:hypothetical protein
MSGGLLCLLVVLALGVLQSPQVHRFALGRLTTFLASQDVELQVGDFRYSVLGLSVDVRNLRVGARGLANRPAFATIGHAHLNLSLTDLLRGRYVLESGDVQDVDINYIVDASGRDNLPRLAGIERHQRSRSTFSSRAFLFRVHASDTRISGSDSSSPRCCRASTSQEVRSLGDIRSDSRAPAARFKCAINTTPSNRIVGLLESGNDDFTIERLHVDGFGSRAEVSGVVRHFAAPELGLVMHANFDAARVASLLGTKDSVTGSIAVDADATGALSAPVIEGRATATAVQFRSLAAATASVRASYDGKTRSATVSSARLEAPWGHVSATGQLALDRSRPSRVRAELARVTVAAISCAA